LCERIRTLSKDRPFEITIFGSSPIQLGLDSTFLSGDVDIFSDEDLSASIKKAGLAKGDAAIYIEQVPENVFIASPTWRQRAFSLVRDNVTLTFPHPIDILVAKIKRLAPKDLRAYHLVFQKTGHPTEAELKTALQRVVDIYRPAFDEEDNPGDPMENTRTVWRELYKKEIDVRAEIIRPALQARRSAYGLDLPSFRSQLNKLGN